MEFNETEQQLLDAAGAQAQKASMLYQQAQAAAQQAHDAMVGAGHAAESCVRTVLALKGVNPDAHVAVWNADTGRMTIQPLGSAPNGNP